MDDSIQSIRDHIVILGWSERVQRIIHELRNEIHRASGDMRPILVITELEGSSIRLDLERVYFMYGRLNDINVLKRANLAQAHTLLIPATLHETEVADGQSVFSLLAALSVNPALRVCVELSRAENGETLSHIQQHNMSKGDIEVVSFESVADRLLAQAAISNGVTRVYDHLLSFGADSNELYTTPLDQRWIGKTFRALSSACFDKEVILLGYQHDADLVLNPKNREYVFSPGDCAWFMAYNRAAGLAVINPSLAKS